MKRILLALLFPLSGYCQTTFIASNDTILRNSTATTYTNTVTTDQTIFSSTVKANTMTVDRPYAFTCDLSVTTSLLSLPAVSFKAKLGSNTLTFVNAAALITSLTAGAITINGYMVLRSDGTILVKFVTQPTGGISPLTLTTGNTVQYAVWSGVDTTVDQTFTVALAFNSTITATTITRQYYARSEF